MQLLRLLIAIWAGKSIITNRVQVPAQGIRISAKRSPPCDDSKHRPAEIYLTQTHLIEKEDNYGRKAVAYLPTIEVTGMTNPVV